MQISGDNNDDNIRTESAQADSVRRAVSRRWKITLRGCDDSTSFEMELSDDEANTLRKVSEASKATSTYGCMPIMKIEAP